MGEEEGRPAAGDREVFSDVDGGKDDDGDEGDFFPLVVRNLSIAIL